MGPPPPIWRPHARRNRTVCHCLRIGAYRHIPASAPEVCRSLDDGIGPISCLMGRHDGPYNICATFTFRPAVTIHWSLLCIDCLNHLLFRWSPFHYPDTYRCHRPDGLLSVVSGQLFSHGVDRSSLRGAIRRKQDIDLDERLGLRKHLLAGIRPPNARVLALLEHHLHIVCKKNNTTILYGNSERLCSFRERPVPSGPFRGPKCDNRPI